MPDFAERSAIIPVIKGFQYKRSCFAGAAEETYCIEALMQDGKPCKQDSSHFSKKNFAKALMLNLQTQKVSKNTFKFWGGFPTRLPGAFVICLILMIKVLVLLPEGLAPTREVTYLVYKSDEKQLGSDFAEVNEPLQAYATERSVNLMIEQPAKTRISASGS
jgi:prolyl-tRNA synthetase